MYLYLIGGVGLALALFVLARLFASANPVALLRGLRVTAIALAVLLGLFVLARGRPEIAAALGAAAAFLWRSRGLLRWLPLLGGLRRAAGAAGARRRAAPGGAAASAVETAWFAMELDHATGGIDGTVRQGPLAGRRLGDLAADDLYALWRAVQGDARSLRLLETFLDRGVEDWRGAFEARARAERGAGGAGGGEAGGAMTREEAFAVLGLAPDAGPAAIKDAHRELMKKLHPDHGGSDWFAAKLNQAKALLLGE